MCSGDSTEDYTWDHENVVMDIGHVGDAQSKGSVVNGSNTKSQVVTMVGGLVIK